MLTAVVTGSARCRHCSEAISQTCILALLLDPSRTKHASILNDEPISKQEIETSHQSTDGNLRRISDARLSYFTQETQTDNKDSLSSRCWPCYKSCHATNYVSCLIQHRRSAVRHSVMAEVLEPSERDISTDFNLFRRTLFLTDPLEPEVW